jgi:phosphoribosylaminoimidazole-succinocarboxamide synthase
MNDIAVDRSGALALPLLAQGRVRDIYDLGPSVLIVATDRISCFDVVLPTLIPGKGHILTQMSAFWFKNTSHIALNHFVSSCVSSVPVDAAGLAAIRDRAMVVKKAVPMPVVAVVRGYLAGSAWAEYSRHGSVCGIEMPRGLRKGEMLPEPIFTPARKAARGKHAESISFPQMCEIVGACEARQIMKASLRLYAYAKTYAAQRGIIIADTKFEFGTDIHGDTMLIDEILTPDSSRFWPADTYEPGRDQASFDKQHVYDYLDGVGFDRTSPAPELPEEVVRTTTENYMEALTRLTREQA